MSSELLRLGYGLERAHPALMPIAGQVGVERGPTNPTPPPLGRPTLPHLCPLLPFAWRCFICVPGS